MDNPFDKNGHITRKAQTVFDTDNFLRTIEAANVGDADAQYRMGIWHLEGGNMFADIDKEKAIEWLTKAAEQGQEKAKKALEKIPPIYQKELL
jgi:TPR repeat protein